MRASEPGIRYVALMSDYPPPPPPPPPPTQPPQYGYTAAPTQYGGYATAPTGPTDAQGRPLAEWWKRVVAYLIDGFVVGVPSTIVFVALMAGSISQVETDPITGEITGGGGTLIGSYLLGYVLMFVIATVYFGVMNGGAKGQTLGKMALKIQVRHATTGGPLGVGRGLGRYLVTIPLSLFTCGIGAVLDDLWPLWDAKRQALHDKVVNSVVVDAT